MLHANLFNFDSPLPRIWLLSWQMTNYLLRELTFKTLNIKIVGAGFIFNQVVYYHRGIYEQRRMYMNYIQFNNTVYLICKKYGLLLNLKKVDILSTPLTYKYLTYKTLVKH